MDPAFYAAHAATEDWGWWHQGRQRVLEEVLRDALAGVARPGRPLDLLDVGCGTGGTTTYLCGREGAVGCDVAREALAQSRRRGLRRLVRASAEALPFPDASFDGVLALDVLEHHDDDLRVARELRRVLRPSGVAVATVPAFASLWGPHDVISHHRRRYRLEQLEGVLRRAGLHVRWASYFNAFVFPAVWALQAVRRALRAGAPPAPASDNPERMPRALNALLREMLALESRWLPRRRLPFGVSALAVAARPEAA
jgi:SAM-dependent methyltransferase